MSSFKVSFNKIQFPVRPNKEETAELRNLIPGNAEVIDRDNFKSFVNMVGNKGCAFCPATFNDGVLSNETFEQSQMLTLYFDSRELTFADIKAKADIYGLPILFAYDSFSIGNRKKLSVSFLNDASIPELRGADTMQKALMTIYPEADESSGNVAKLHHGGNRLLYVDETMPEINIDSLFMNMTLHLRKRHGATNYKRKVAEFAVETGIRLNEKKLLDVSVVDNLAEEYRSNNSGIDDKKSTNSTMMILRSVGKLSDKVYQINFGEGRGSDAAEDRKQANNRTYRSEDLKSLSSHCQLFQEFESGEKVLSQSELIGLASNISQAYSGAERFKSILSDNSYFNGQPEKYDNWDFYFYYIKERKPMACSAYCPYQADCPHGKNLWSMLKVKYRQMERISGYFERLEYVTVDEASEDFNRNLMKAVNSPEKGFHIIKAQTANGKTHAILEFLQHTDLNVLIADPTNALKREFRERAADMGVELTVSPSLHEMENDMPADVWDDIKTIQNSGRAVMPYLNKTISENGECSDLFRRYKRELDEFNNAAGHAVTTHRRLSVMDVKKYDIVLIDEDIVYSTIIPNKADIFVSALKKVLKELKKINRITANGPLAAKIRKILKFIKESDGTPKLCSLKAIPYTKKYDAIPMGVDIASLCSATDFCYRKELNKETNKVEDCVSFLKPIVFSPDVKYIMVSATVNKTICEHQFGADNVTFYNCKEARYRGILYQYYNRLMSRTDMKPDPDIIGYIQKQTGSENVISFKIFKEYMEKYYKDNLHYGACAGRDHMKGKPIDVIGTPHQPDWVYKLYAYSLKLKFDPDEQIRNRKIEHNGYKFWFATFEDQDLRDIQFYMIESDAEQAVGRARLLREECDVHLFSNFPLSQAVMKEFDYDKK